MCGVRGHLAHDYPQNTTASRGGRTSNAGQQFGFVHRGTAGNRSRGRRTHFSGLNVIYGVEGNEYPVDDTGTLYFLADE